MKKLVEDLTKKEKKTSDEISKEDENNDDSKDGEENENNEETREDCSNDIGEEDGDDDDDEEECTDDDDKDDDEACCPEGQCVCLPPESCHNLETMEISKQQPLTRDEPPDDDCNLCIRSMEPGEAILACSYCHFAKCNECIRGAARVQD